MAKGKQRGSKSRSHHYAMVEPHAKEIIEKLLDLMRNGDNSNVQMGAAKTLLNKIIPDLKAIDYKIGGTGEKGSLLLKFVKDESTGD